MYQQAEDAFDERSKLTIDDFKEDWQLSQFWYSDSTAETLLDALLEGANEDTVVCIASAPSVYAIINKKKEQLPTKHIYLFEFDKRFELLSGADHFGFYDYNEPLNFRKDLVGKVDRLLLDPPFLEPECQQKSSITAKSLLKDSSSKFITCTGERMSEQVHKNYSDIHTTSFFPEHKNGLSNEFRCYANFECSKWKFAD